MPELTAKEAVEKLNEIRGAAECYVSAPEILNEIFRRVPNRFTPAPTCDDVLAELAAAGHFTHVARSGSGDAYRAWNVPSQSCEGEGPTPLAALQALRGRLIPAGPVPMTEKDVEEITGLVHDYRIDAPSVRNTVRQRLMRHVVKEAGK